MSTADNIPDPALVDDNLIARAVSSVDANYLSHFLAQAKRNAVILMSPEHAAIFYGQLVELTKPDLNMVARNNSLAQQKGAGAVSCHIQEGQETPTEALSYLSAPPPFSSEGHCSKKDRPSGPITT